MERDAGGGAEGRGGIRAGGFVHAAFERTAFVHTAFVRTGSVHGGQAVGVLDLRRGGSGDPRIWPRCGAVCDGAATVQRPCSDRAAMSAVTAAAGE